MIRVDIIRIVGLGTLPKQGGIKFVFNCRFVFFVCVAAKL